MKQQYISYQQTIDFLKQAMGEHPHLIRLQTIGETWEGRPIIMVTMSLDVAYADEKPALLYTGTIHAREWIGIELSIAFIKHVIDNYKVDPKLLDTLSRNTLYMVPCLNPDGFEYSRNHFSFWRKNRRDNGDGTFGVDLNRNFGVRFKQSNDTSVNTYGGPAPFSEPETRAIKDFVERHPNITIALDYHSQGNVFFPAHKFNHEAEVEGTDLNVLCANMAREIERVTGRRYGIHRGKPPTNLIHGSGREYYYSQGIIGTVVEVGTRNIPDYLINMSQSVDENIPAVLYALKSATNYSKHAPKRVENFTVENIGSNEVTLSWDAETAPDLYFEIYRAERGKSPCVDENLVAITRTQSYTDVQLKSGHRYFYNIRAVDRVRKVKSPWAPEVQLKTLLAKDEFSHTAFPMKAQVGYVGERTLKRNAEHFGHNSLFVGVNRNKGCCFGVIMFQFGSLPIDVLLRKASLALYPMDRVNAKIERYGEWSISILDEAEITDITSYDQIANAQALQTLGNAIESDKLTQGIWSSWNFTEIERGILSQQFASGRVILRIEGPTSLPQGHDSQMMQFDIGYGRFGGGIHYRPSLQLIYTKQPKTMEFSPAALSTIAQAGVKHEQLQSGFDAQGDKVYGSLAFSLAGLPKPDETVITTAYVKLSAQNKLNTNKDIRFTMELAELEDLDYQSVRSRDQIEFVGYEVSNTQLKENSSHDFVFDSYCRNQLEQCHSDNRDVFLLLRPTTPSQEKNALIDWFAQGDNKQAKLVIEYIERRKQPLPPPTDFKAEIENGKVKLSWTSPSHQDLVGCYVVRNRFHPPRSPFDGVKLYGGKDGYTYDSFGNANIPKYYSVFSYDDVPNYSQPASMMFSVDEVIHIEEDVIETQEEEEERLQREDEVPEPVNNN
ncbi:fibronectin type III domain-containing protein [Neiella marina]|uniref:Fibronectin type III domain-containing protein n=1 Tax=Neiella holothuriorum TaxID=2870530 RepID=A0ABS7EKG2_9GAMM|nr:M14 family zinc carboxypeptidase [Neiella holothuriorum]MBW8192811.1 fibronectin type III domain-containing protein [Neiella holothuriorum]